MKFRTFTKPFRHKRLFQVLCILLVFFISTGVFGIEVTEILVPDESHPAVRSAAELMAEKMNLPAEVIQSVKSVSVPKQGQLVLAVLPVSETLISELNLQAGEIGHDGYAIGFRDGGAVIVGKRPRSLLYAAGDVHLWKDNDSGAYLRSPSFAIRSVERHGEMPIPEYVAALGLNVLIDRGARTAVSFKDTLPEVYEKLDERDQRRLGRASETRTNMPNELRQACHDADVEYYTFLYGNNFELWSDPLYEAAITVYPSAKGQPAPHSWEKAALCPSDPITWKLIDAYLREYMAQTKADGLYVTFWDNYGIYCQCDRCRENGLNTFRNQVYECVKHYHQALSSLGKKLVVRTWSSGVPHWLRDEWVHAPGYDHFGGSGVDLWGRVFEELPEDILIQTKVYHSDCQPAPPFAELLGKANRHTEIAEYQMTGQTTGRYYFPASTVNHTAWTMKKSRDLLGADGGVNLFLGGTRQTNYFLLDDILNSVNVYAWRQLSWDVDANVEKIYRDWAIQTYGEKAGPYMAMAMQLSEDAVNQMFSTLGMGSSTNSDFAGNIARRETLLQYTNRHYRPEFAKNLEPTKDNIRRVIAEKEDSLQKIRQMVEAFEKAKPNLPEDMVQEIQTRFDWMREFAIIKRYLEESLFRFRYLRYLNSMRTTDPDQMKYLNRAYDRVREHSKKLFQYDPEQKFRCYDRPLGELRRKPLLGNPMSLMRELYEQSKVYTEEIVGPDYLQEGNVADKPLYRDPVHDGAADPVVVRNKREQKWFIFYTNRRANVPGLSGVTWVHGTPIGIAESTDGGATWHYKQDADIDYTKGDDTYWAPEVIEHNGTYHMYLTYVPGIFKNWSHPRHILHLTSNNLLDWEYQSTLPLACDKVIDACVFHLDDGTWRMWYNNEKDSKSIYYADSKDLYTWIDKGKAIGDRPGEGPKVFRWKGYLWMVVDVWRGLGIYRSEDGKSWTRQDDNVLQEPGTGDDDRTQGHHADVVVNGERAYLFYFTHPGRRGPDADKDTTEQRRSSIQVTELKYRDSWLRCNRDAPTLIDLKAK